VTRSRHASSEPGRLPGAARAAQSDRRALVTGASGFVGARLVAHLIEIGWDVTVVVRRSSSLRRIDALLEQVTVVEADLASVSADELCGGVGSVAVVYHLAASGVDPSDRDPTTVLTTNVVATLRTLEAAKALGARRFVYCGSCFEYGGGSGLREDRLPAPRCEYGASKVAGWVLAQAFSRRHGLPVTALRPFTIYGPGEAERRLVPYVVRQALAGEPIELTGGDQQRDFVFVDDAVDAFVRAAERPEAAGRTFNVCTGTPVSVCDIVTTVLDLTGSTSPTMYGALPYRDTEVAVLSGDATAARTTLGWTARTPLRAGLAATIGAALAPSDRAAQVAVA
jgi:nucleoside-diphosphate-sugar epimerase